MASAAAMHQYTRSDLRTGMKVFKEELSSVYDTWIILYRPKDSDMEEDGIIGYIGEETNAESDALYTADNTIIPIYNDSSDLEGDIYDEE